MIPVVDSLEQCSHARKSSIKEMCINLNAYRIAYKNKDSSICKLLKNELNQKHCLNDVNPLIGKYRKYLKYCKTHFNYPNMTFEGIKVVPEELNNVSNEVDRRDLFCGWLRGRHGCKMIKKEGLRESCLNLYYSDFDCDTLINAEYRAECKRFKNETDSSHLSNGDKD